VDKQTLGYIFGAIVVLLFYWFKIRNPYSGKNDRRKNKRRSGLKDRRVQKNGRRKSNQLFHESKLPERRHHRSERRVGEKTRRHTRRRKEDNIRGNGV